jgi:hypothetical protein
VDGDAAVIKLALICFARGFEFGLASYNYFFSGFEGGGGGGEKEELELAQGGGGGAGRGGAGRAKAAGG